MSTALYVCEDLISNVSGLDQQTFSKLMDPYGPFEETPHVAVAVSGGSDSMALCLLLDDWVRARGGQLSALTVDHGLRAAAAEEARQTGGWLAARNIDHHVLHWHEEKPRSGIQAAARAARYNMLETWCRDHGVLHLAFAHHRDDQAETYLMRRARRSGYDGLAGMAALSEVGAVRRLRPLLAVSKSQLQRTLRAFNQPWIEDPSNQDVRFERVCVRQQLAVDQGHGVHNLWQQTVQMGYQREQAAYELSSVLAAHCHLDPAGFVRIRRAGLQGKHGLALFRRVLSCIGGTPYPPGVDKVAKALTRAQNGQGGSVGGCLWRADRGTILVCRESRNLPMQSLASVNAEVSWDGRFRLRFLDNVPGDLRICALGRQGWNQVKNDVSVSVVSRIPYEARLVLPCLKDDTGVSAVPSMGYTRSGQSVGVEVDFRPLYALAGNSFVTAARI